MAESLYPNLLTDATQYRAAEVYWQELWRQLTAEVGRHGQWHMPWFENPFQDGNPIFSALCEGEKLGVRLLQYDSAASDELDLDWWTDTAGEGANEIRELVI